MSLLGLSKTTDGWEGGWVGGRGHGIKMLRPASQHACVAAAPDMMRRRADWNAGVGGREGGWVGGGICNHGAVIRPMS